ncbi:hypothetical protein FDF97_03345 [Clostridium botulinum]|uniref:Uncharacterized protein n=1 Tax=Clostridium botulinum TaxID=1491 RepID=A0AA44BMX1_CLOBO|nr:hypothetical protein [Clostridium botulinum]NFI20124.1 hypothetical protein [Clostridium botulinum]NFQ77293.1 hypothetical protein [Clostridium botulinum]
MLDLFKKIYEQDELKVKINKDNILFSEKENKEYYITVQYTENEFERFYDSEKSKNLISFFDELKKNKADIQKNTSLIICLKLISIQEIPLSLKNIIFSVEEDEYFFRKYVIIYTENSTKNIELNKNIKEQLHEIIKREDMMKQYQKNCYFSEEFFLAMQLFVKLPFIVYEGDAGQFIPVEDKLEKAIKINDLECIYDKVINFKEELKDDKSEYISKLTDAFLAEKKDNNILNDFFNDFERIE